MRWIFLLLLLVGCVKDIEVNVVGLNLTLASTYDRVTDLSKAGQFLKDADRKELKARLNFINHRLSLVDVAVQQSQLSLASSQLEKSNKDLDKIEAWINERKPKTANRNTSGLKGIHGCGAVGDPRRCFVESFANLG